MRAAIGAVVLTIILTSCVKDELPVQPRDRGGLSEAQVCIGTDQAAQVWYDIGTASVVREGSKMDHDLAFECGADGWRVRLNGARLMRSVRTSFTSFAVPLDTTGMATQWQVDGPDGSADSTAIGDWRTAPTVYAIDLGYNTVGLHMGVKQLLMLAVDAQAYTFTLADADGGGVDTFAVYKDYSRPAVYFSISAGTQVDIAPPLGSFDLVFTQYTHRFTDPPIAYLVTGAVLGNSGARVAELHAPDFAAIALSDTVLHPFTSAEDAIGYDWKLYDFDTGTYIVDPTRAFILQDREGYFYKLHFIDYYNDMGERGCPTFEVVAL